MKAIDQPFTAIINGNRQFVIPVFQRDYSWTLAQCEQLWKDVQRASKGNSEGGHFMGSIVYVGAEVGAAFQSWLLIDGQQRLTTLTLLLLAMRDHIKANGWSGGEDSPTVDRINAYYLQNTLESGNRRYKLLLRRRDNATLQALVDEKNPLDVQEDHSELLVEAYTFFRSALKTEGCDLEEAYRGVVRLRIVDVTLARGIDNPQLVFESMNSTGVDLQQSDLVRNYLLMGLNDSDQTRLYDEYWSRIESLFRASGNALDWFLRDYVALARRTTQQMKLDRIYEEFKVFWSGDSEIPLEELLADMLRVAQTYASFLGIAPMRRPWLADAMGHMRSLNTTQGLLIMSLYDCHEKELLSQEEFVRAVTLIESYLLRRAVLGMQTRDYWSVFARIARDIDPQSAFDSFQVALARLRDSYRFPSDEEFSRGLHERELYGLRVCKHVLDRIENAGHKEPSPVQNYSIEHILPQEIGNVPEWQVMLGDDWSADHELWVHRLGNLTLTAYNSRYGNRPFDEKKAVEGGFQQSAVRLNQYVKDQSKWTVAEMGERASQLIKRALTIWMNHTADAASIQAADIRDLKARAAKRNSSHLKMSNHVRSPLDEVLAAVREFGEVIEVIEHKSVGCYAPSFFAEIMPMKGSVRIILPMEFSEVENPEGLKIHDASRWKFVPNRMHANCDLLIDVWKKSDVVAVTPMIRQAFDQSKQ